MTEGALYLALADSLLVVHFAFVAFVVLGFILILAGLWRGWKWVGNLWFRIFHLLAIGIVVAQAWLGKACPLTVWESTLRAKAGAAGYNVDFLQYWLHKILYFNAPAWVLHWSIRYLLPSFCWFGCSVTACRIGVGATKISASALIELWWASFLGGWPLLGE